MDLWERLAPAKVNLFLHVGPLSPDGYHPICSLMTFADFGDGLSARKSDAPALTVRGPGAESLGGPDNLVSRAAEALRRRARRPVAPLAIALDKRLPVAAGIGGGSADAAAALRLLDEAWSLRLGEAALMEIAAELGSDVPACLAGRPVIAEGRGERLSPAPASPGFDAVLVNPGVASPTGPVFAAYDQGPAATADRPALPEAFESVEEAAALLALCRNDLEAPAVGLEPRIGDVLETLRGEPEALLARMSGSGATCFALCAGDIEAEGLAERIEAMRPDWWVRRCRLA